jgi:3-isopropylmalate/(R)-2-methylmalate dehydratase small subunit
MEPVRVVTGTIGPLYRADIDTDQIIPKQFLKRIERTGFGEFLFWDWRGEEDFPLDRPEYAGARVLVGGPNFGCGSSREHAPWAIQDFGYRVVIAPSFADIFRTNCTKIGLLPVQLPEADARELHEAALADPAAEVTVDLERRVVVMPGGREVAFAIDPAERHRLLNGLDDIGITLEYAGEIETYERTRAREGPSTLPFARA